MRSIWIFITCLISSPLLSQTIGNVEFQLPASNYEWKLLTCLSENAFLESEDDEDADLCTFTVFTHREGDALETLSVFSVESSDEDDNDDEFYSAELVQKWLEESFGSLLPNHKILINALEETETTGFIEWELNDGSQDIAHGFLRGESKNDSNGVTLISYVTTAEKTEHNRVLWTHVLKQAVIHN